MDHKSIGDFWKSRAKEPDSPFLIDANTGREWLFFECERQVRCCQAVLSAHGIPPGARVGIVARNSVEQAQWLLACALRNNPILHLHPGLGHEQLEFLAQKHGVQAIIAEGDFTENPAIQKIPLTAPKEFEADEFAPLEMRANPDDLFALVMTSGTTGGQKACRILQRNVAWTTSHTVEAFQFSKESRHFTPLPLYHINAQVIGVLGALAGGGAIGIGRSLSGKSIWRAAQNMAATSVSLVPTQIRDLIKEPEVIESWCPHFVICSSAPLDADTIAIFEQKYQTRVLRCYGLSEASCYASYSRPNHRKIPGASGQLWGCEARVVARPGDPPNFGEIWLKGLGIFDGYDQDQVSTANTMVDEWLCTGDLGTIDAEGNLHIRGRAKELINRGGEKLSPSDLDATLELATRCPMVKESCFLGATHERLGEAIYLTVVAEIPDTELLNQIWDLCEDHLPPLWRPDQIVFVDDIPKSGTGKIQRTKLAAMLAPKVDYTETLLSSGHDPDAKIPHHYELQGPNP